MRQPDAETMARHPRAIPDRDHGSLGFRRVISAVAGWINRGQLAGESLEMTEMTRYTGGRF